MKLISTKTAPKPVGHYSQGVVHGGLVYVAGQVGIDPENGKLKTDSIEEETEQALKNVAEIVRAAGGDVATILKVTIFVSDNALWGKINEVYANFFGDHKPARAIIPCAEFSFGLSLEIEAIAAVEE